MPAKFGRRGAYGREIWSTRLGTSGRCAAACGMCILLVRREMCLMHAECVYCLLRVFIVCGWNLLIACGMSIAPLSVSSAPPLLPRRLPGLLEDLLVLFFHLLS